MLTTNQGGFTDSDTWLRVRMAPLPGTRDGLDFCQTLASLRDLPLSEARLIVSEYRRFLYLCAISDAAHVAPAQIRMAWELHAGTPGYTGFCDKILGKPLPLDETSRMLGAARAYRDTRTAYRREFGERPPSFVWPDRMSPRLPRWLGLHALILGGGGAIAWQQGDFLALAAALGLSLLVYGADLWGAFIQHRRRGDMGAAVTDDLSHFLNDMDRA